MGSLSHRFLQPLLVADVAVFLTLCVLCSCVAVQATEITRMHSLLR